MTGHRSGCLVERRGYSASAPPGAGNRQRERQMSTCTDYEAPTLLVIGCVSELTNEHCIFDKSHGKPDYVGHMHGNKHITNCSS
jgi:hypothetical protein